jgi:hypothetical protein
VFCPFVSAPSAAHQHCSACDSKPPHCPCAVSLWQCPHGNLSLPAVSLVLHGTRGLLRPSNHTLPEVDRPSPLSDFIPRRRRRSPTVVVTKLDRGLRHLGLRACRTLSLSLPHRTVMAPSRRFDVRNRLVIYPMGNLCPFFCSFRTASRRANPQPNPPHPPRCGLRPSSSPACRAIPSAVPLPCGILITPPHLCLSFVLFVSCISPQFGHRCA